MAIKHLSPIAAILININIVIGSAFFLGAQTIAHKAGIYAPALWIMCALLLFPLMKIFAFFSERYPDAGGIYVYSEQCLGSLWGFISGWGYFIGTIAGNAAVIKAFTYYVSDLELYKNLSQLFNLPPSTLWLDLFFIFIFSILSLINIQFLEKIQFGFTVLKTIPFLVLFLGALTLGSISNFSPLPMTYETLTQTIPLVLFAFIGIEGCTAVMDKINHAKNNGFKVIVISFLIITLLYSVAQAAVIFTQGRLDVNPFLNILPRITSNPWIIIWGNKLIYGAILLSFLGGFYGMFYFNNWNLYALGKKRSIVGSCYLTQLNSNGAPWVSVTIQGITIALLLWLLPENDYLITMSDFGVTLAYFLTAISFLTHKKSMIGFAGLISCLVLITFCTRSFLLSNPCSIIPFIILLLIGVASYYLKDYSPN